MKKITLLSAMALGLLITSCSKEKKISKILWKKEGTWEVTTSDFAYYSMGTYNTSTGKYQDSTILSAGNFNGNTIVFNKADGDFSGTGTQSSADTTINFNYQVTKDMSDKDVFYLNITETGQSTATGYTIVSHDKTNMTIKYSNSSGWSTTPGAMIHAYINITMKKK